MFEAAFKYVKVGEAARKQAANGQHTTGTQAERGRHMGGTLTPAAVICHPARHTRCPLARSLSAPRRPPARLATLPWPSRGSLPLAGSLPSDVCGSLRSATVAAGAHLGPSAHAWSRPRPSVRPPKELHRSHTRCASRMCCADRLSHIDRMTRDHRMS